MTIFYRLNSSRPRVGSLATALIASLCLSACSELSKTREDAEIDRIYDEASAMLQPGMNGDQMFMGMMRMINFVSTECARDRVDAEASGADAQTVRKARQWEQRCRKEVAKRLKLRGNAQADSIDPDGNTPDSEPLAYTLPRPTQPMATNPSLASGNSPESWADQCVGYFKGSASGGQFALEVTNRPLVAEIVFSDFSRIKGAPAIAVAQGRLKVRDYQTGGNWLVTCQGNRVLVQSPNSSEGTLIATRSSQRMKMSEEGEE